MKMKKIVFVLITLLSLGLFSVFANGASETGLYYYPRNVVNNSNVVIDLSDKEHTIKLSGTDFGRDFVNNDAKHLGLFRIEENISNYNNDQYDDDGVKITIKSLDNWTFVHETNLTSTREFTINAFKITRKRTDHWSGLIGQNNSPEFDTTTTTYSQPQELTQEAGMFSFYASYSAFDKPKVKRYVSNIFEYDIAVELKPETGYLEAGYYTTRLEVTVAKYKTHKSDNTGGVDFESDEGAITYNIVLRGHVGDYEDNNATYNFLVTSANDTYKMDLGKTIAQTRQSPFQVARVQFLYALSNQSATTPRATTKFRIYISPSNNYRQTYGNNINPYYFYARGTEYLERDYNNTVWYQLCDENGNALPVAKERTGTSTTNETTISSTTYQILPDYDDGYTAANRKYNETWRIDKYIYLYVVRKPGDNTNVEPVHDSGIYFANIYFTLVVE